MGTLITLLVIVLVAGILWWAVTMIPLPDPAATIVRVVFAVILALVLLSMLFGGIDVPHLRIG